VRVVRDTRWGRSHLVQNLAYVLAGGGAVFAAVSGHLPLPVAGALVLAAVAGGIGLDAWRFNHYRCGCCGRTLAPPRRWGVLRGTGRLSFTCRDCGVVWRTRLSREA